MPALAASHSVINTFYICWVPCKGSEYSRVTHVCKYNNKHNTRVNPPRHQETRARAGRKESGGRGARVTARKQEKERGGGAGRNILALVGDRGGGRAIIPPSGTANGARCLTSARARATLQNDVSENSELVLNNSYQVNYPTARARSTSPTSFATPISVPRY